MIGDLKDLKKEVFYPYPPQRVWQVLTNDRALAAWLMENNFEPRVGHRFQFQGSTLPGLSESIDCEVIEIDEPRRLSYTWQDKFMTTPSIVTWILEPQEDGTQLRLEHKILQFTSIESQQPKHSQTDTLSQRKTTTALAYVPETISLGLIKQSSVGTFLKSTGGVSIILTSFLCGRWEYKLEHTLPQVLR